ncbi:MAG: alkaline phosphatase family protein [bacterium]
MSKKILLLQIAALGYNFLKENLCDQKIYHLNIRPIKGLLPALTCPVQATIRTATLPSEHGIVGNGFFFSEQWKALFWEQSSRLIEGSYIWEKFRSHGKKVAQMFIQQSLGPSSDLILSPAPIHKHHGGMILTCFSEPPALNQRLEKDMGGVFPLHHYWGPLASKKSSAWITKAIISVIGKEQPDFLYTYLPHLDYNLQRFGPYSKKSKKAFEELISFLGKIVTAAKKNNYRIIVFGDYPITPAHNVIFPNKILRKAGLFKTRLIRGKQYPNYFTSSAFCITDHQIAHLHIFDPKREEEIKVLINNLSGIDKILNGNAQADVGLNHPRSGDIVLVAAPGYWFDYRWWDDKKNAPDYATHIDIHNKPGYDPCELFWGWPPPSVSQNPFRIQGTHGRIDEKEPVFYASDMDLPGNPESILGLSKSLKELLDRWK